MSDELKGERYAILATDGFEEAELNEPCAALEAAGAIVDVVAPKRGHIQGMRHHEKGERVAVHHSLNDARSADYAGLVLPGGVANPDALRLDPKAVAFVRAFFAEQKPVAAICHAPWLLIEAGVVRGRTLTSWPSLETDLKNAGADWVDREVVLDRTLVTSRGPADLPAFCRKMLELFRTKRREPVRTAAEAGAG
jgi:protease I